MECWRRGGQRSQLTGHHTGHTWDTGREMLSSPKNRKQVLELSDSAKEVKLNMLCYGESSMKRWMYEFATNKFNLREALLLVVNP